MLWSYAKLDHKHEALFAAAAEHATQTIHTFQPQSMASSLTVQISSPHRDCRTIVLKIEPFMLHCLHASVRWV